MSGFTYSDWSRGATPPPGFTVYGSDLQGPTPPSYEPPRRRSSGGGGRVRGVLAFVTIAVVLGLVRYGIAEGIDRARGVRRFPYGTTLHTPPTIGTTPRLHTALAKQLERGAETAVPKGNAPQAAVYGRGSTPRYIVVALLSGERSDREAYEAATRGFTLGAGNVVEFASGRTMPGGVYCGRVRLGDQHGAACGWSSHLSNGFLMDISHPALAALAQRTLVVIDQVNGEA